MPPLVDSSDVSGCSSSPLVWRISDPSFVSVSRSTLSHKRVPNHLMCEVQLNCSGRQVMERFLVDTGACGVYLHFNLAKKLYGEEFPSSMSEVSSCIVANDIEVETFRGSKTALTVQGRTLTLRPFAMKTLSYQGILGYDALHALGFMVDTVHHRLVPCADVPVDTPCLESDVSLAAVETGCLGTLAIGKACTLAPKSALLVPAILQGDSAVNEFCLLEQTSCGSLPDGLIVISGLATMVNSRVSVFLLNTTELEIPVHRSTRVADALRIDHRPLPNLSSISQSSSSFVAAAISKRQQFLSSFSIEDSLPRHEKEAMKSFLWKERDVFSESDFDIGCFQGIKHHIDTGAERPYRETLRRHSPRTREDIKILVNEMLRNGIIEPSFSPWSSAPVLVQKKNGGKRFAVDYRGLNLKSVKDSYPLPQISDALDCFAGARYFSTLDLTQGFWQIELDEESKLKTAFSTPQGLYQFRRMPFGLCNAPATFQRAMACCLEGLNWEICLCFLDDVIVFAKTFEEHLERLRTVFSRFRKFNLKLKPQKCEFLQAEVAYLGHRISARGITTDPSKIESIQNMQRPRTVTQVRSFLGLAQYYRRFVKGFSMIAAPLYECTKHGQKREQVKWGEEQEEAFLELKRHLQNPGVMMHPNWDLPFIVDCDASQVGIGCVLSQVVHGKERVISYQSHKFSRAEKKWSTTDREFYALVMACKLFKSYLYGRQFTMRTDHQALLGLRKKAKELCGKLARWWSYLCNYDYHLVYRKGEAHGNADGLSRQPQFEEEDASSDTESEEPPSVNALLDIPYSPVDILSLQRDDPVVNVLRCIVSGQVPDSALKDLEQADNDYVRHFMRHRTRYSIKNNILMMDKLAVVPRAGLPSLLFVLHDSPISGHLGRNKIRRIVRERFWWPFSVRDVDEYVRSCIRCQARKANVNKVWQPLHPSEPMDYPWQRVAMDIVKLPKSNGYEMLLVVVDYFSKWVEAFPIRNKSGETVADLLLNEVFLRYTTPEYLHSDRGKEFMASVVHELSRLASIYQTHTPAYTPRADGQVERVIRTLTDMLSTYHLDKGSWFPYLNACLCALRSAPHETTGFSPYEVLFGRKPRLMVDLNYGLPAVDEQKHPSSYKDLQARFQSIHREVKKRQTLAADRMKEAYDSKRKVGVGLFAPGQWVWVAVPKGPRAKFLPKWDGPYLVHRANEIGTLYLRRNGEVVKTPQDRCKLFAERPTHLCSQEYKDSFSRASVDFSADPPALVLDKRSVPPSVPSFFSSRGAVQVPSSVPSLPRDIVLPVPPVISQSEDGVVEPGSAPVQQSEGAVEPSSTPAQQSEEVAAEPSSTPVQSEGRDDRGGSSDLPSSEPSSSAPSHLRPAGAHPAVSESVPPQVTSPATARPNMPSIVGESPRGIVVHVPPAFQPEIISAPSQHMAEPPVSSYADSQSQLPSPQGRRVSSREKRRPDRLGYDANFKQVTSMQYRRSCWQLRSRCPLFDLGILVGNSSEGPVVLRIEPGSVADRQHLCKPGDRVTHVNGLPVASALDYLHGLTCADFNIHTCRVTFVHT